MRELSKREAIDIMQSDMKLWDTATTEVQKDGTIVKSLHLPFGIGETSVTLQGLTDAGKKRHAVTAFGEYIRGLIEERIDDDAVTARAKAAAAKAEQADSADSPSSGSGPERVREPTVQAPVDEEADQAHEADVGQALGLGETLAAQRATLREQIGRAEDNLAKWRRELTAVEAGLDALGELDASADS